MKVAVTGANGFVGGHTVQRLKSSGHTVRALVRNPDQGSVPGADEIVCIPSLNANADPSRISDALAEQDAVIHLAAKVHVLQGPDDDASFANVNVQGSVNLLKAAARAGVRRFIFMSSVKAAGERTSGRAFDGQQDDRPEDAYGRSKLEAEQQLRNLAQDLKVSLIILRPVFVYGWPPAGNFRTVVRALEKGLPLPFAGIRNARDMIFVGNLADASVAACEANEIGTGPYYLSDGEAVSTPELFQLTAAAMGVTARLFPFPLWALKILGQITGRKGAIERLTEDLEVSSDAFCRDVSWLPPYKMTEGLAAQMSAGHVEAFGENKI